VFRKHFCCAKRELEHSSKEIKANTAKANDYNVTCHSTAQPEDIQGPNHAVGIKQEKIGTYWTCTSGNLLGDRHTTDMLITVLHFAIKAKSKFCRLLRSPVWKRSGPTLKPLETARARYRETNRMPFISFITHFVDLHLHFVLYVS